MTESIGASTYLEVEKKAEWLVQHYGIPLDAAKRLAANDLAARSAALESGSNTGGVLTAKECLSNLDP